MKRSERMKLIEKLARQREDQAAGALAQTRQRIEQENGQLRELHGYRDEYQTYLEKQGSVGLSIQQWRRTQGFIDQLGDVIQQQQEVIQRWRNQEQQLMQSWQRLYQRRRSLTQLVEKISMEEFVEADRKEQKALDELVGQMMRQNNSQR